MVTEAKRKTPRRRRDIVSIASVPATLPPPDLVPETQDLAAHAHFRAHARKPVRTAVVLRSERGDWERPASTVDLHIAGAGIESDEPLTPGERITVAFSAPTLWDPLVLSAVVAWAQPRRPTNERDALGRPRAVARAGLAFDYASPEAALAMFEMLLALGFE